MPTTLAPDVGIIEVIGPEAATYLHNLATNDVANLPIGGGCETFFANHKARAIAHAAIFRRGEHDFVVTAEDGRAAALHAHLDRHLISERVELTLRGDDWGVGRVIGSAAPTPPWHGSVLDESAFTRTFGGYRLPAVDFVGPRDLIRTFLDKPDWLDLTDVELPRIEAGWPKWGHELDENRFVVEVGRTATAISYAKGCYLGQEPIVMARDRGQANRQLMGFRADPHLPVGATLMKGEVELFRATSVVFSPKLGATAGLAYVYRGHQSPGTTVTIPFSGGEATATLESLPMSLL